MEKNKLRYMEKEYTKQQENTQTGKGKKIKNTLIYGERKERGKYTAIRGKEGGGRIYYDMGKGRKERIQQHEERNYGKE